MKKLPCIFFFLAILLFAASAMAEDNASTQQFQSMQQTFKGSENKHAKSFDLKSTARAAPVKPQNNNVPAANKLEPANDAEKQKAEALEKQQDHLLKAITGGMKNTGSLMGE